MTAYHGTTKTGLTQLMPFANAHNERSEPCVYLAAHKALALLHIWDKPYRRMKIEYIYGQIFYFEPYPGALEEFYGGVAGSIYTCKGIFKYLAQNVFVSRKAVAVIEEEYVPDALTRIQEYERQGLLRICRSRGREIAATAMTKQHIAFVLALLHDESIQSALHLEDMPRKEWERALRRNLRDKDEANFVLYQGGRPMGWLKLNGLKGDMAWISMLAIHPAHQRQGAGHFAVRYAEQFARERGFARLGIHTTADNAPARACYGKLGYTLIDEGKKIAYIKDIGRNG